MAGKTDKTEKFDSMSPITFRISFGMLDIMEKIVKSGEYTNRAEFIREAIKDLINYESKIEN